MKKYLLSICTLCLTAVTSAQTCPQIEGLSPVTIRFGSQPESNFPTVPLYWNRFYKIDETTGLLNAVTCSYTGDPNLHEFAYCACYLTGLYFRRVTDVCDPTPCGGDVAGFSPLPKTNNNNSSSSWSQPATWTNNQLPDMSSAAAALVTKSIQVDADLTLTKDHWLSFSAGNSSISAAATIVCNSVIRVYAAAQLENFGVLKGSGQIAGDFVNSGTVSPGNSPGKLTVVGNYTATATAVHQVEIAALNLFDTLSITQNTASPGGIAVLNGTLNIALLNGYVPSVGDSYKIISFTAGSGTFANVNLPALPGGLAWTVRYNTSDVTLQVIAAALPVSFVYTKVYRQNNSVQVEWGTANEINVKNYALEKSADGIHFSSAGNVNAIGTGNNHYSWLDISPAAGNNYYRIKSVDLDGKFMYAGVLLINMSINNKMVVWPNPVKRNASIYVNLQNSMITKIELVNAGGQILYSKSGALTGITSIPVDAAWPAGQYLLRIIGANKMDMQKILIQ